MVAQLASVATALFLTASPHHVLQDIDRLHGPMWVQPQSPSSERPSEAIVEKIARAAHAARHGGY